MTPLSENQKNELVAKFSLMALYLVFGVDISLAAIAYIIKGFIVIEIGRDTIMIRNVFLIVAIIELGAIQLIKRSLLSKLPRIENEEDIPYQGLTNITYIIAAMCVSIATFGLIIVTLGGSFDFMLLFLAISLIGFQIFRLRNKDLDKLSD